MLLVLSRKSHQDFERYCSIILLAGCSQLAGNSQSYKLNSVIIATSQGHDQKEYVHRQPGQPGGSYHDYQRSSGLN